MAQVTVKMQGGMKYDPKSVSVKVGDTVVWTNEDSSPHTATADDGSFDTGRITKGNSSKPVSFSKAGKVPYHCTIHGPRMSGTVEVSE